MTPEPPCDRDMCWHTGKCQGFCKLPAPVEAAEPQQPGYPCSPHCEGYLREQRGLSGEREIIAAKAREWAEHYPQSSDGRNTFILFAEWVESR